jgi:hypothetical protein
MDRLAGAKCGQLVGAEKSLECDRGVHREIAVVKPIAMWSSSLVKRPAIG